jgi:hypothetical protein
VKLKSVILLSSKSAGSSAFQKYLLQNYGFKVVLNTPHHESETLFWTKAASALGLPQQKMHRSAVPYTSRSGKKKLMELLKGNNIDINVKDEESVFNAFKSLVEKYGPFFFEKSPHHLYNFSNIELMLKGHEYLKNDIELHVVGLIRNPLDTIYSAWKRWRYNCAAFEHEWKQSYLNLEELKKIYPRVEIFRYEDIVKDITTVANFCKGMDVGVSKDIYHFNQQSLAKRGKDSSFLHRLDPETIALARRFGYHDNELVSSNNGDLFAWKSREAFNELKYRIRKAKSIFKHIK